MASTTIFKPSTDSFGHLTLHGTILGDEIITPEVRKARINAISLLLFVLILIAGAATLYVADQSLFAYHDNPTGTYNQAAWMIVTD